MVSALLVVPKKDILSGVITPEATPFLIQPQCSRYLSQRKSRRIAVIVDGVEGSSRETGAASRIQPNAVGIGCNRSCNRAPVLEAFPVEEKVLIQVHTLISENPVA